MAPVSSAAFSTATASSAAATPDDGKTSSTIPRLPNKHISQPSSLLGFLRDASANQHGCLSGLACILAEGHQESSSVAAVAGELYPQSSGGGNGCDEAEVDAVVLEVRALWQIKALD